MRKLHELYEILYDEIEDYYCIPCLCRQIRELKIYDYYTDTEYEYIYTHFKSQRPTRHNNWEFYYHASYQDSTYWWNQTEDATEQRKLFIQKMIQITKEQDI